MKYEDLSFDIVNDEGLEVTCDITAVIPNPDNSEEPYVTYTDYMLDENDNFKTSYGQIITENNETKLKVIKDTETINKIIELSNDEIVKYVNEQVQDNLS
jgi:hypothetical protein